MKVSELKIALNRVPVDAEVYIEGHGSALELQEVYVAQRQFVSIDPYDTVHEKDDQRGVFLSVNKDDQTTIASVDVSE